MGDIWKVKSDEHTNRLWLFFKLMRSLKDILSELTDATENTDTNIFSKLISKIERSFWKSISKFIDKAGSKGGRFSSSKSNEDLLNEITTEIEDSYEISGIGNGIQDFLQEFDTVEKLTKEYFRKTLRTEADPKDLTQLFRETRIFKTKQIDDISNALLDKSIFRTNITNEYRDILFEGIVFNQDINEVKSKLRESILSKEGSNSKLKRYVHQVTQDAMSQYQGALQDKVRAEYDLDGVAITGSIVDASRVNSINLVCKKSRTDKFYGKFDDYKLKGTTGSYRYDDLEEIIDLMSKDDFPKSKRENGNKTPKGNEGFNPSVTPETFAQYSTGYGNKRTVIYFRILDDDIADKELESELKK